MDLGTDLSMGVKLDERTHTYTHGRIEIPSVSQIIMPVSALHYGSINKKALAEAARKGKVVHQAIEDEKEFGFSMYDEDVTQKMQSYKNWAAARTDYEHIASEQIICHKARLWCGKCDELCMIGDYITIIDFKTTAAKSPKLWSLQLTGYALALVSQLDWLPLEHVRIMVLWIPGDKYEEVPLTMEPTHFRECLSLTKYIAEEHKNGR